MLPLLLSMLVTWEVAQPLENFFMQYHRAWDNEAWGQYCFDLKQGFPTCGWKLVLTSSSPLTKLDVYDSSYDTTDNLVFTLTSLSYSGDFRRHSSCSNINMYGTFGNMIPNIFITWLCICDNTTHGDCKKVFPPTSTSSVTSDTGHPLLGTYNPQSASMECTMGSCYKGDHFVTIADLFHLVDCGIICASLSKCMGINYRSSAQTCELIYQSVEGTPDLIKTEIGCDYWKVISVH